MNLLTIAQCTAAAAFLAIGVVHLLVWTRVRSEVNHLLFAVALTAAAGNAFAEANIYRSDSIASMAGALRWYVATSGLWVIATVWFVVAYAGVTGVGRGVAAAISGVLALAMLINFSRQPASCTRN